MNPFGAEDRRFGLRIFEFVDRVGPRASGIHHYTGANAEALAGECIAHRCTGGAFAIDGERGHRRMVEHHGAVFRRVHRVGQRQSHIVGRRIPVAGAAEQVVRRQLRLGGQRFRARVSPVPADVAKEREQIVQPEAGAEFPSRNARPAVERPRELQRMRELGREVQQQAPLAARLEHQVQKGMFEVAHAAVYQAR